MVSHIDVMQLMEFLSNLNFRGYREIKLITFLAKILVNCKSSTL